MPISRFLQLSAALCLVSPIMASCTGSSNTPLPSPEASPIIAPPATPAVAPPVAPTVAPPVVPHEKQVGDWTLNHSEGEGFAVNGKTQQRIELYSLMKGKAQCVDSLDEGTPADIDYSVNGRLLSIVGSLVSYAVDEGGYCGGAHPFAHSSFRVIDLQTDKAPPLDTLFAANEINAALDADSYVKGLRAEQDFDGCKYAVDTPDSTTTSYAFHHLKDGKVAVRIGLSHTIEVCRGSFEQVGIYLTPSAELLSELQKADKVGLLMKDNADK